MSCSEFKTFVSDLKEMIYAIKSTEIFTFSNTVYVFAYFRMINLQ